MRPRHVAASALLVLGIGCSSLSEPSKSTPASAPASAEGTALDLSSVMRDAHFAFRANGDDFGMRHGAWSAKIDASGALHMGRITVRTLALSRGGQTLLPSATDARTSRVVLEPRGGVRVPRGAITEHFTAAEDGVAQSWDLARAPAGTGDLRLRVGVDAAFERRTRSGLHFVAPSGDRISYGDATWIDANGRRTSIEARWDGEAISLVVPEDVVARAAYPVTIDPTIGPELAVDQPLAGFGFDVEAVHVSPGKDGAFLVTWRERTRTSPDAENEDHFADTRLLAARIGASGQPLDASGIEIAPIGDVIDGFGAAHDGASGWLVAWGRERYHRGHSTVAVRLSDAGAVLDPNGIDVGPGHHASVAFDGTAFQIALDDERTAKVVRVSAAGQLVGTPTAISTTLSSGNQGSPTEIACDGSAQCLVGFLKGTGSTSGRPHFARVTKAGVVLDPGGTQLSASSFARAPRVVATASGFMAFWGDAGSALGTRVAADGTIVDASARSYPGVSDAAFDGTNVLTVWSDGAVRGARLAATGIAVDATPLTIDAGPASEPRVAYSGGRYLTAWRDGSATLAARRVEPDATMPDPAFEIDHAANAQSSPALARTSTGFVVAWEDWRGRGATPAIMATKLSKTAAPVSGMATELVASGTRPAIACEGEVCFLAWLDNRYAKVARYDVTTGVLGVPMTVAGPMWFSSTRGRVAVVFDGDNFVFGWSSGGAAEVARITPAGTLLDSPPIDLGGYARWDGAAKFDLATSGNEILAVWSGNDDYRRLFGARVSKAGVVLDAAPFVVRKTFELGSVRLFWDGLQYVAVWTEHQTLTQGDLYAARISPAGTLLDPQPLPVATGLANETLSDGISMDDGATSLLVWSQHAATAVRDYDLVGRFMRRSDGAFLDATPQPIAEGRGHVLTPVLAPAEPASVLLAYARYDGAVNVATSRVRTRFVSSGIPAGSACTASTACSTRFCSDALCCESACDAPCSTCSATPGACTVVKNAEDPGSCDGDRTCDGEGKCRSKPGGFCEKPADCLSGFCVSGICCDRACGNACETCAEPRGTCTLRASRATGAPTCAPYACDGKSVSCPTSCASNDACPQGTRCEGGQCVGGDHCVDERTVERTSGETVDCAPYVCEGTACRTSCADVADCAFPAICDEEGRCLVPPPPAAAESGCSIGAARSGDGTGGASYGLLAVLSAWALRARRRRRLGGIEVRAWPGGVTAGGRPRAARHGAH